MSTVRFATLCDVCGKRSEEYARFPRCIDCGDDICPNCTVSVAFGGDPDKEAAVCPACDTLYSHRVYTGGAL